MGEMLPIHVSDTPAASQDGLSLEFVAATMGRECNIQDARGGGLWLQKPPKIVDNFMFFVCFCNICLKVFKGHLQQFFQKSETAIYIQFVLSFALNSKLQDVSSRPCLFQTVRAGELKF